MQGVQYIIITSGDGNIPTRQTGHSRRRLLSSDVMFIRG